MLVPLSQVLQGEFTPGWSRGDGDIVYGNPGFGQVIAVATCKDDGMPLFDAFLHFEPVGAVTVPMNSKGQLGLITVQRPQVSEGAEIQFPLPEDPEKLATYLAKLGRPSVEVPRGFPFEGEASEQTAKREGAEELGSPILEVTRIGQVAANTTFHPHPIPVFKARIDEDFKGNIPGDVNEKILRVDWHDVDDVKVMVRESRIYCGFTLSALTLTLL